MEGVGQIGSARACVPVPYLASQRWYAEWLGALAGGLDDNQARKRASLLCCPDPRDFSRRALATRGQVLTVPLSGGGRRARHLPPEVCRMADHGRWPDVHIGAIRAVWGRTPFFDHFIREVAQPYASPGGRLLSELTEAHHRLVVRVAGIDSSLDALRGFLAHADAGQRDGAAFSHRLFLPEAPMLLLLMQLGAESLSALAAELFQHEYGSARVSS